MVDFLPINKKLWTSSFVCAVAGYSLIWFSIFYYIIDVKDGSFPNEDEQY